MTDIVKSRCSFPLPSTYAQKPGSTAQTERWKKNALSYSLKVPLDRVNVLGDDDTYGHTGCVNALSWARDGELLLSGGDDTTVRVWRMNQTDTAQEYPFTCRSVIHTGHRANIFNAHMLPFCSRIATAAGDKQIRVFDIEYGGHYNAEAEHHFHNPCMRVLRCHTDRVKRIVTENSPDLFLSVAEDGSVRQHDLRMPHTCGSACPAPLIKLHHELSSLALSPLTPYQFVVAGDSPYGYLFDRRHAGRFLREEWGNIPGPAETDVATCVRRFGRSSKASGEQRSEHITGVRMSANNGHEVLLSYSSDAVYLYNTHDEPQPDRESARTPILLPNVKRRKLESPSEIPITECSDDSTDFPDVEMMDETETHSNLPPPLERAEGSVFEDDSSLDEEFENPYEDDVNPNHHPKVPVVLPRLRFAGACNVETVKDVNFLGPNDEYVVSGSDDGNFFIWDKATGLLCGLLEGDSSVVNVIEGHPHLPLVAVSGIDTTVKLFAPAHGHSTFSRMDKAESIIRRNERKSRARRVDITDMLLASLVRATRDVNGDGDDPENVPQCTYQ